MARSIKPPMDTKKPAKKGSTPDWRCGHCGKGVDDEIKAGDDLCDGCNNPLTNKRPGK